MHLVRPCFLVRQHVPLLLQHLQVLSHFVELVLIVTDPVFVVADFERIKRLWPQQHAGQVAKINFCYVTNHPDDKN